MEEGRLLIYAIPCDQAWCGDCVFCQRPRINLCTSVRAATGGGVMLADKKSRFTHEGKPLYHFMGTSCFAEYSVRCGTLIFRPSCELHDVIT